MGSIIFTPASLLDLLSKVDELSEYNLDISETYDGDIQLTIGDSTYLIESDEAVDVPADDAVVDAIDEANLDAYENLDGIDEVNIAEEGEPIESGILKETAKTLLVGGLVRLTGKLLK